MVYLGPWEGLGTLAQAQSGTLTQTALTLLGQGHLAPCSLTLPGQWHGAGVAHAPLNFLATGTADALPAAQWVLRDPLAIRCAFPLPDPG